MSPLKRVFFPPVLKPLKSLQSTKKGSKTDIKNYRPISILPCLSKLFEYAMKIRLDNFFSSNNLISNMQHGFRKNKSTNTAIFEFLTDVASALNNRHQARGIFIDLSKAFDSINHEILLNNSITMVLEALFMRGCSPI